MAWIWFPRLGVLGTCHDAFLAPLQRIEGVEGS